MKFLKYKKMSAAEKRLLIDDVLSESKVLNSKHFNRLVNKIMQAEGLEFPEQKDVKQIGPITDHPDGIRIKLGELKVETLMELKIFIVHQNNKAE